MGIKCIWLLSLVFYSNFVCINSYIRNWSGSSCRKVASLIRFKTSSTSVLKSSLDDVISRNNLPIIEEFDLLYESIKFYKEYYGTLIVPLKFSIPHDANWPSKLRGFRLGRRLDSFYQELSILKDRFPKECHLLEAEVGIGFSACTLLDDWNFVFFALRHYKRIFGNLRISASFIIPHGDKLWPKILWGLKLGNRAAVIRNAGTFIKGHPNRKQLLEELGFEWNDLKSSQTNDIKFVSEKLIFNRFCNIISLLQNSGTFERVLSGESLKIVPNIPINLLDFPFMEALKDLEEHGRFLGNLENVEYLMDLEFPWNTEIEVEKGIVVPAGDILLCLRHFKATFDTYSISQHFIVPYTSDWPSSCRGVNLYSLVEACRASSSVGHELKISVALQSFPIAWIDNVNKIDSLVGNFDNEVPGDEQLEFAKDLTAQNQSDASEKYRVPMHPRSKFPMDVTYMFENMRFREWAAQQIIREKTNRMNVKSPERYKSYFDWKSSPHQVAQLLAYQIPPEDREKVETMGYRFLEFGEYSWEDFLQALHIFKNKYGHVNVPYDYEINSRNEDIELFAGTATFNMELGYFVEALRCGDFDGFEDDKRRKILDELGFDWGDMEKYLHFRFLPFIIALRLQHQAGGFEMGGPDFKFKVTKDYPYFPFWLQHVPLGEWYQVAKMQRSILEKYYPDRFEMLNNLEFQWWWPFPDQFLPKLQEYRLCKYQR